MRYPRFSRLQLVGFLFAVALLAPGRVRAQVTETPQTMGSGNVLMRVNAFSFGVAQDTVAPNQITAQAFGTVLASFGVTENVDFQVGTRLYVKETYAYQGQDRTDRGIGQVDLRTKVKFWEDKSSGQEAALIPYVSIPTHSAIAGNRAVQGGVILPWSMDLAAGFKAGAMIEWDELRNAADTRYDTRWYGGAMVHWQLGQLLGLYGEATLTDSTAGSSTAGGTVGFGATLAVSNHFTWDFEESRVLGPGRNAWTESLRFSWRL